MITKPIACLISGALGVAAGGSLMHIYLTRIKKIKVRVVTTTVRKDPDLEDEVEEVEDVKHTDDEDAKDIIHFENEWMKNKKTIDYSDIKFKEEESESDDDDDEDEQEEQSVNHYTKTDVIHEITEDEFIAAGNLGYDRYTIAYFEGDGSLINETDGIDSDEEVFDQVDATIGSENLERFINDEDADALYIKNDMFGAYYEVYKRMDSYEG